MYLNLLNDYFDGHYKLHIACPETQAQRNLLQVCNGSALREFQDQMPWKELS